MPIVKSFRKPKPFLAVSDIRCPSRPCDVETFEVREDLEPAHYLLPSLDPAHRERALENARCSARRWPTVDVLVVTGVSGIAFGALLAHGLGLHLAVVRKEERRHSPNTLECAHPGPFRWVFVDDHITSGATANRVFDVMKALRPRAPCVGIYLYQDATHFAEFRGARVLNHGEHLYRRSDRDWGRPLPF
jgi:adenine/guanine phosphoribosyltransferase-like PRPP-binding protein